MAAYALAGPLPVYMPSQICTVGVLEVESEQALATVLYTLALAGCIVAAMPALETPVGPEIVKVEKVLRR